MPAPLASVYGATKAGLQHFAHSLAAELRHEHPARRDCRIDVLCVTPGYVACGNTPRWTQTDGGGDGFFVATPDQIARASLAQLGAPCVVSTVPWWPHVLQLAPMWVLPRWLAGWIVHMVNQRSRLQLQSREQDKAGANTAGGGRTRVDMGNKAYGDVGPQGQGQGN